MDEFSIAAGMKQGNVMFVHRWSQINRRDGERCDTGAMHFKRRDTLEKVRWWMSLRSRPA